MFNHAIRCHISVESNDGPQEQHLQRLSFRDVRYGKRADALVGAVSAMPYTGADVVNNASSTLRSGAGKGPKVITHCYIRVTKENRQIHK
jgi:hypothetical protein